MGKMGPYDGGEAHNTGGDVQEALDVDGGYARDTEKAEQPAHDRDDDCNR